jgi:hypothetical protein
MGLLRSCSRLPVIAAIVAAGLVVAACSGLNGDNISSSSTATSGTSSNTSSASTAATGGTSSGTSATATYAPGKATVIGKSTHVVIDPAASAALKHAGVTLTPIAPATAKATLLFPVSGGQIVVATLAGTVDHTGGLTFRHSGKSVTLANIVINTKTKHLTARVGRKSMPIFDLNLASPERASGPHSAVVSNIKLTITSQAATALNSGLGVSTFEAGRNFGIATLTVAYARGHR